MTGIRRVAGALSANETGKPAVAMTSRIIGRFHDRDYFFITTGKVNAPNLYAYDLNTGQEVWHSAPSVASDHPGPDSCAMSSSAIMDQEGNIFISDCHYLYSYRMDGNTAPDGTMQYKWRHSLPNLYQYNRSDGLWYPVSDPALPDTVAKPFITCFLPAGQVEGFFLEASPLMAAFISSIRKQALFSHPCILQLLPLPAALISILTGRVILMIMSRGTIPCTMT